MAKIIDSNDIWFQEVAPRSYYNEGDLERTIVQNLEIIFPEFKAIPFKKELLDPGRNKKSAPDLAMIKIDYSEWYLIEVELGGHPIGHVIDQITTFYSCSYTDDHADYIYKKSKKNLSLNLLKKMIAAKSPELMVIVNEPKPDWSIQLKTFNCKSCIFQIYQNSSGDALYRLEGEHPIIKTDFCHCKYQNSLPYVIEVLDKHFLDSHGISDGTSINIEFRGKNFLWARIDAGSRVFLECSNPRPPLDPISDRYRLNFHTSNLIKSRPKNFFVKYLRQIFPTYFSRTSTFPTFSFTKD